jgi:hypothetical protein
MKIVITQFTDAEPIKERITKRFGGSMSPEVMGLLTFVDHAKARLDAMRQMNGNVQLEKRFIIDGTSVRVTAKTVSGTIPKLLAKFLS